MNIFIIVLKPILFIIIINLSSPSNYSTPLQMHKH